MQRSSYRLPAFSSRELYRLATESCAWAGVSFRRIRPADFSRIIVGAEVALTMVLAVVAGRLVWTAFEPPAFASAGDTKVVAKPHRAATPAILTDIDPFHRAAAVSPAAAGGSTRAPETMLNLQLFGIRAGLDGSPGSAIVGTPDNMQGVYAVGQEIMPGVRLEQVLPDRVVIRRNGVTESLSFDRDSTLQQTAAVTPVVPSVPAAPTPVAEDRRLDFDAMKTIALLLRVSPVERGDVRGLLLEGSADPALLQQTGLEPGDLLLSVNGTPVSDSGTLASLAAAGAAQGLTLEIERKGQRKFHRLAIDRMQ